MSTEPLHDTSVIGAAPSGLDHGGYSTGKGYVTRNLHLVDLPEISHPMIVLQQVSIVDCNLEVVRFHQDLYLETKHASHQVKCVLMCAI